MTVHAFESAEPVTATLQQALKITNEQEVTLLETDKTAKR
jgi:hypothetical protein